MDKTLAALIEKTTATILDDWAAEAAAAGTDADDYTAAKLDAMENDDPDAAKALSAAYLRRVLGCPALAADHPDPNAYGILGDY
jgi:hypothetical protein